MLSIGAGTGQAQVDAVAGCFASLHAEPVTHQACQIALANTPQATVTHARIQSAVAMLSVREENLSTARVAMDTALAITEDDAVVQGNLGSLLIREGDFHAAIIAFSNALSMLPSGGQGPHYPSDAALYLNRSLALRAIGRYDNAAKDYAQYLALTGAKPAMESFQHQQNQKIPVASHSRPST